MNSQEQFKKKCIAAYETSNMSELNGSMGLFYLFTLPEEQQVAYIAKLSNISIYELVSAFTNNSINERELLMKRVLENYHDALQQQEDKKAQELEEYRTKYVLMLETEKDPEKRSEIEWRLRILNKKINKR